MMVLKDVPRSSTAAVAICDCSFQMVQHDICFLNEAVHTSKHVADLYGHPSFRLNLDSYIIFLLFSESYAMIGT